jgi:hypothetical protein
MRLSLKSLLVNSVISFCKATNLKSRIVYRAMFGYLDVACPVNSALTQDVGHRVVGYLTAAKSLLATMESLQLRWKAIDVQSFIKQHGRASTATILCVELGSMVRFACSTGTLTCKTGFVYVEQGLAGAIMTVNELALSLAKHEVRATESRTNSLRDILDKQNSPVFVAEMILWLFTRACHTEEVLGDFREAFEKHQTKYGTVSANKWCREQTVREVWNRLSSAARVTAWLSGAMHAVTKHFRR